MLARPEAEALRNLVQEQAALKQHITRRTRDAVAQAGRVLRSDDTADFAPSQRALTTLNAYVAGLSPIEQNALNKVPFDCKDSHTGAAIRDTVGHQLSLAASGGECIHRLGDFLTQAGR